MSSILNKYSWRYLLKHPLQTFLSLLGVAIGVAVLVSIDLANQSAFRAFQLSMDQVAGRATHHLVGGPSGFSEELYHTLRVKEGIRECSPVVEGYLKVEADPPVTLNLVGVDPFAENPFRSFLGEADTQALRKLMIGPGVIISRKLKESLGLHVGDPLPLKVGGEIKVARLVGSLENLDTLIFSDIAFAQEALDSLGKISRIDLIAPENKEGEALLQRVKALLPPGVSMIRTESRSKAAAQMMKAFNLNLTAMSLLALIVGMFLIYNTMTFAVMQRRVHLGLLRSLGITRNEIFRLILGEALLLGGLGTVAGILLGIVLGQGLVDLVSRTINDLYFVLSVRSLEVSPYILGKGLLMGLFATLAASFYPAREAAQAPPISIIQRSSQEIGLRKKIPMLSLAGLLALVLGVLILAIPSKSTILGYTGMFPLILGFSLLTPVSLLVFVYLVSPILKKTIGILGPMASRSLKAQISRTSVAIAALGLAMAATVGVGATITSFRQTVILWLGQRLDADLFITEPGLVSRRNDADVDPGLPQKISKLPGFKGMNYYRQVLVQSPEITVRVIGSKISHEARTGYVFKEGNPNKIWTALESPGAVIVSEPFAFQQNKKLGDAFDLSTDKGNKTFRIHGIYFDYGSDIGGVTMPYSSYRKFWEDPFLSGVSVYLKEGADTQGFINSIRRMTDGELIIRTNRDLREASIKIFDRTFVVAHVLQLLAIAVAFIGILSSLMALQLERSRELAILRINGMTPRQLGFLVTLQTALMGFVSGILSLPLGGILAWILIHIINRRSFGWTLQFDAPPSVMVQAVVLAVAAALAAGIYPIIRMTKVPLTMALREE